MNDQMDLNEVLPALDAALNSLRSLNKNDVEVNEMKLIYELMNEMKDLNEFDIVEVSYGFLFF